MIARICQATTPQQPKTEEIHFSIKRMFKLYFKSNLCMLIHFPFCFASFMTKRDFLRVHQMPLKALILHSFGFPLKASMFLRVSTPEGKNRKQTLYYDDFLLRWLYGVLFAFGCERRFEKKCFLFFSLPFLRRRREKKLCHVLILPLFKGISTIFLPSSRESCLREFFSQLFSPTMCRLLFNEKRDWKRIHSVMAL